MRHRPPSQQLRHVRDLQSHCRRSDCHSDHGVAIDLGADVRPHHQRRSDLFADVRPHHHCRSDSRSDQGAHIRPHHQLRSDHDADGVAVVAPDVGSHIHTDAVAVGSDHAVAVDSDHAVAVDRAVHSNDAGAHDDGPRRPDAVPDAHADRELPRPRPRPVERVSRRPKDRPVRRPHPRRRRPLRGRWRMRHRPPSQQLRPVRDLQSHCRRSDCHSDHGVAIDRGTDHGIAVDCTSDHGITDDAVAIDRRAVHSEAIDSDDPHESSGGLRRRRVGPVHQRQHPPQQGLHLDCAADRLRRHRGPALLVRAQSRGRGHRWSQAEGRLWLCVRRIGSGHLASDCHRSADGSLRQGRSRLDPLPRYRPGGRGLRVVPRQRADVVDGHHDLSALLQLCQRRRHPGERSLSLRLRSLLGPHLRADAVPDARRLMST
mmetsp:Transcript_18799/g.60786  ORF Transcript_18799/g.60786 Transcript_18799/m.60786 type:complete len:429 (+) Transcript_18799:2487-3773(+)